MRRIKCWFRGHYWVAVQGIAWAQECANCTKPRKCHIVLG